MSVKGLVHRYESLPTSPSPTAKSSRRSSTQTATPEGLPAAGSRGFTPLSPATTSSGTIRIPDSPLRHPLLQRVTNQDETRNDHVRYHGLPRTDSTRSRDLDSEDSTSTLVHTYPPSDTTSSSRKDTQNDPWTPVPATTVFSRKAHPLYLPKLDAHLSSFQAPNFSCSGKGKHKHNGKTPTTMFPPMDALTKSGYSLDELTHNSAVTPGWRNRSSLFESIMNAVLSVTGSSALAMFYSVQGLFNTLQIFALILSTIVSSDNVGGYWRELWLGTIPRVVALNFASTLTQSLIYLSVLTAITVGLLFYFRRSSMHCDRYRRIEGLQDTPHKGSQWGLILTTFFLTVLYLPLSTVAVNVLVWSSDLWVVPYPYTNGTTLVLPPLGLPEEFREPLDFCWTSTMRRNEINFAPVLVVLAAIVVITLTIWFPIALHRVIKVSVPKVDPYTELGRRRNQVDLDTEYRRLLSRDNNPFAFLYIGFRRGWGTYQSIYLFSKFSTLMIIAILNPDNCLFRHVPRFELLISRQVILLAFACGFFIRQCLLGPFLDPINNASEWVSRLTYVLTSALALLVIFELPGKDVLNTYILYLIYALTYGLGVYFFLINRAFVGRLVKRMTQRVDFSIDIFSPRLDLTSFSPHLKRRIWQESITSLLLTDPECKIPRSQTMLYAQSRDSLFSPYLLNFKGTPGERHVENLKILRELGALDYYRAVALRIGPESGLYTKLGEEIQHRLVGPDCYWKDPSDPTVPGRNNYFGNAWWVPFPPTLVLRYDDGPYAVLKDAADLRAYIEQNSSRSIRRRMEVRMALRSLENQSVFWPYEHVSNVGGRSIWHGFKRYRATTTKYYQHGILKLQRNGHLDWKGLPLGSGFSVQLVYAKNVTVEGEVIGLGDDFELTAPLARFLSLNRTSISSRLLAVQRALDDYRSHHRRECKNKANALTYAFLTRVYDQPQDPLTVVNGIDEEPDPRVRKLLSECEDSLTATYERFETASASPASVWWYLFWDDFWRRNHDTVSALETHTADFSPYYTTSIAYRPLPRPVLESFLVQRGLLSQPPKRNDFFHVGLLNKIYLMLNEAAFRGSNKAILFHLGNDPEVLDMESVDFETVVNPSSLGTGPGTAHNDSNMISRPNYRWEGLLEDPLQADRAPRRRFLGKLWTWLGLTPFWKVELASPGLALHVRLVGGRYVPMEDARHDDEGHGGSRYHHRHSPGPNAKN